MKEVIKHGKYINTKVCPDCGCEFTYTTDELQCLKEIENGMWRPYFWYVTCPECFEKVAANFDETFKESKDVVYIDMDGVIVDFESGKKHFTEKDLKNANGEWDNVKGIYSKMVPVYGAVEAVKRICQKYDVYILSTAPWNNPSAWCDKIVWLKQYFGDDKESPLYKRLILSHHKDLCRGNYLIDDNNEKNGVPNFRGELIHFGSKQYPNWDSVLKKLGC